MNKICFYCHQVSSTTTKMVNFEVFLSETNSEPIKVEKISVTAEIHEILFCLQIDNPLDMGVIPVRSASEKSFILKNCSCHGFDYVYNFKLNLINYF